MSEGVIEPAQPTQMATERPPVPGIMVFTATCRLLYSNGAARDFLKRLSQEDGGEATDYSLQPVIARLFNQTRQVVERRPMQGDEGRLDTVRLVVGRDQPVLLQAFGFSDRVDPHRSRIVVRMEAVATSVPTKL